MNLCDLFPVPRPVPAGGVTWQVLPLRLRDRAAIQALARDAQPHPLDGRRGELQEAKAAAGGDYLAETPEGRRYAELIRDRWLACAAWPPRLGGPEAAKLLGTDAGLAGWLQIVLSRTHPDFGPDHAVGLLKRLARDVEGLKALEAAAYGDHPLEELSQVMDPAPRRTQEGGIDWPDEILRLVWPEPVPMVPLPRMSFAEAGDLFVGQWLAIRTRGRWEPGEPRGFAARVRAVQRKRDRLFESDDHGATVEPIASPYQGAQATWPASPH